jgi:3-oxoacyl-[acyl-carrier protein] reductase
MNRPGAAGPGVAVVSGGSSGIGLATVETLLGAGWRVAFFSQQAARVAEAERALSQRFPSDRVMAAVVDLRDSDAVRGFFQDVASHWQAPAGLVCNAGISPKGPEGRIPLAKTDLGEWDDVLRVNLTGALLCCQAVLPGMVQAGQGRIVIIGSLAGRSLPRIAGAAYVASKSALGGLTRSLVSEYSHHGITANLVCPGRILGDMAGAPDSPTNRAVLERVPIGRLGKPIDVARVVEFLLRPGSDFINGTIIDVNGGEFLPA